MEIPCGAARLTWGVPCHQELPETVVVIRFLQLMCEGHYLANQDLLREQPNNKESTNLLDHLVEYLGFVTKIPNKTSSDAAEAAAAAILELIQVCMWGGTYSRA
jgi:hypothetical protein